VSKQVNLVFFGGGVTKVDDWVEDEEEDKEVFESGVSISIDNMRMRWEYQIREITFI
jgi:glucose dehydrogenase